MSKKIVKSTIFDLDGTLIDSSSDIIESLSIAFTESGLDIPNITAKNIGPKLQELIDVIQPGLEEETKKRVILNFRNIYDSIKKPKSTLFSGAKEALESFKKRNIKLFIATNKPESATLSLLKYFGIINYFDNILTPTSIGGKYSDKGKMVNYILEFHKLNCFSTILVGDHKDDMEAAKINNVRSVAFLGGYSHPDILRQSNPDFSIEQLSELIKLF